jgi:uncharacterized protein YbcC (UPF0753/DUF2309 family)
MTKASTSGEQAILLADVDEAARIVAPLWPLSSFIAVNPLWGLREHSFDRAVELSARFLGVHGYPSPDLYADAVRTGRLVPEDLWHALDEHGSEKTAGRPAADGEVGASGTVRARGARAGGTTTLARYDASRGTRLAESTDAEVARWCAAYAAGVLAHPDGGGLYAAWRWVVARDPATRRLAGVRGRAVLASLPDRAEDAILASLERLGVAEVDRVDELSGQLARMPGWAGHALWRSRWAAAEEPGPALHLLDYLAVRLGYDAVQREAAVDGHESATHRRRPRNELRSSRASRALRVSSGDADVDPRDATLPDDLRRALTALAPGRAAAIWLAAYEAHFRDDLLGALGGAVAGRPLNRPLAQAVFCIDTRSEGLRRHLEARGRYETFGFAGFFGLPMRFRPWGAAEPIDLCPALVRPVADVGEYPAQVDDGSAARRLEDVQGLAGMTDAFAAAKKGVSAAFVLAEAGGFAAGPLGVAKTVAPSAYARLRKRLGTFLAPRPATVVEPAASDRAMTDDEQALFAETMLATMGLTRGFAPLVLLCGHGSTTENNPYASALDCGACGGNRGASSARAAAAILNRPQIRLLLESRGIAIPDDTIFLAGEHETVTDVVKLLDLDVVPHGRRAAVAQLQEDLDVAGASVARERARRLPGARQAASAGEARSADWAEIRPEWGLARNAAFVVGPRALTAGVDLDSRCFLHSYDPDGDADGLALETILTAPMVVAHWINAQYYFSTVDPDVLGAGDKTAHNIVGGIGVLRGCGGDLQVGLPLQSVFDADRAYHEPMRLLVAVVAPRATLEAVVRRNAVLRDLFDGRWVHVVVRDDEAGGWAVRRPGGTFVPWEPAGRMSAEPERTMSEEIGARG